MAALLMPFTKSQYGNPSAGKSTTYVLIGIDNLNY